jgi:hypothetical protein
MKIYRTGSIAMLTPLVPYGAHSGHAVANHDQSGFFVCLHIILAIKKASSSTQC